MAASSTLDGVYTGLPFYSVLADRTDRMIHVDMDMIYQNAFQAVASFSNNGFLPTESPKVVLCMNQDVLAVLQYMLGS